MYNYGIMGRKGSGKSHLAKKLWWEAGVQPQIIKFAEPIKKMVAVLLTEAGIRYQDVNDYIEGNKKEDIIPLLGKSSRYCQQIIGTEAGRDLISPSIWGDIWSRKVEKSGDSVICDDVRFDNEVKRIINHDFVTVRVMSPNEKVDDTHRSEKLAKCNYDVVVLNDKTVEMNFDLGTLEVAIAEATAGHTIVCVGREVFEVPYQITEEFNYEDVTYELPEEPEYEPCQADDLWKQRREDKGDEGS